MPTALSGDLAATGRGYRGERDYRLVRDFLVATYPTTPLGMNWEVRRWDGWFWDPAEDGAARRTPRADVRLWTTGDGSLVGLDFDATVAWPAYDWMGVAKAALEATSRYLARDLGGENVRVNLVSAGPIRTAAAGGIPGFDDLADLWTRRSPLAWDVDDAGPVADAACFLLSDMARAISGEIVHVDGGAHSQAG